MKYCISKFSLRQTEKGFVGTKVSMNDMVLIENHVNDNPDSNRPGYMDGVLVWDIPVDLCGIACPVAEITLENEHLLTSRYESRRDGEIPVLVRYFEGVEKIRPTSIGS